MDVPAISKICNMTLLPYGSSIIKNQNFSKPPQMTEFIENYLISLQNLSALFRLCFQPI